MSADRQRRMHRCRDCGRVLDRGNTGGFRNGVPDVCRDCEHAAYVKAHAEFTISQRAVVSESVPGRGEQGGET